MLFVTIQRETALLLKTVKCVHYLGYVLLRYILIYDPELTYLLIFSQTFLRLIMNAFKMFTVQ